MTRIDVCDYAGFLARTKVKELNKSKYGSTQLFIASCDVLSTMHCQNQLMHYRIPQLY